HVVVSGGGGEPWGEGAVCHALQAQVGALSMGMSWCMWWSLVVLENRGEGGSVPCATVRLWCAFHGHVLVHVVVSGGGVAPWRGGQCAMRYRPK
ncbi:MAG: hypothetical protein GY820_30110, partial [Gammaproteobacteria bacterium]|nr:hypothetical protein [Gammaproteobacteria bacterium]